MEDGDTEKYHISILYFPVGKWVVSGVFHRRYKINICTMTQQITLCLLFSKPADFFQNRLFQKILLGLQSECQTVSIQISFNILSGLIWVHTVCKGYQQRTLIKYTNS